MQIQKKLKNFTSGTLILLRFLLTTILTLAISLFLVFIVFNSLDWHGVDLFNLGGEQNIDQSDLFSFEFENLGGLPVVYTSCPGITECHYSFSGLLIDILFWAVVIPLIAVLISKKLLLRDKEIFVLPFLVVLFIISLFVLAVLVRL